MRPNEPLANAQLGITLLRLNRNVESLDFLHRAAEEDPHSPTCPALFLADALILTGQPTAAAETLESYLRNHPDDPEIAKIRNSISLLRSAVSNPQAPQQYF
jgi:predicted Zn-dependent protease